MEDITNLKVKVERYKQMLNQVTAYREAWNTDLKKLISDTLEEIIKETGLPATLETNDQVQGLEAVTLNLGSSDSGLGEMIDDKLRRPMIKSNGMLLFQQLFNGKLNVMIMYPHIEGYGEPRPPMPIGIFRPEEIQQSNIIKYVGKFLKEINEWEDFDDDDNKPMAKIGFGHQEEEE